MKKVLGIAMPLAALITVLSGCQLASESADNGRDWLIGVYLTPEPIKGQVYGEKTLLEDGDWECPTCPGAWIFHSRCHRIPMEMRKSPAVPRGTAGDCYCYSHVASDSSAAISFSSFLSALEDRSSFSYMSGRRSRVRRMACFRRHLAMLAWWPDRRTGGTRLLCQTSGREY